MRALRRSGSDLLGKDKVDEVAAIDPAGWLINWIDLCPKHRC